MHDDFEGYDSSDFEWLVNRYEDMIERKDQYFFDVSEFENIIDYYIDNNRSSSALSVVNYATRIHPQSINLQLKKAQVLLDKGFIKECLQILKKIEKIEPSNSDIFLTKGAALTVLEKFQEAENVYNMAIDNADGDKFDIILEIAESFNHIGKSELAYKYLEKGYSLNPEDGNILFSLASISDKIGENDKSIYFYQKYLDINPFSDAGWFSLGNLFERIEEYEKAIDSFEFALAINPDFAIPNLSLASIYHNLGNYQEAIRYYKEFMLVDGDSPEVYGYLGDSYLALDDHQTAVKYYDQAIKLDVLYSPAIFGKAEVFYTLSKFSTAIQYINRALDMEDENPEYHFLKGKILFEQKKSIIAIQSLIKAFRLSPDEMEFALYLSEAYIELGKIDEAIKVLESNLKENDVSILRYRLAGCYLLKGKKQIALAHFKKGLKILSHNYAEIYYVYPDADELKEIKELIKKTVK